MINHNYQDFLTFSITKQTPSLGYVTLAQSAVGIASLPIILSINTNSIPEYW